MPQPPFVPSENDQRTVLMFVVCGINRDKIAEHLGISKPTLYKHFADELENGMDIANAQVAGQLFKNAIDGNVTAQIFWMKTRARWSDRPEPADDFGKTIDGEAEEISVTDREFARRTAFLLERGAKAVAG